MGRVSVCLRLVVLYSPSVCFWTGRSRLLHGFRPCLCLLGFPLVEEYFFFLREVPSGSGAVRDDAVSSLSAQSILGASTSSIFSRLVGLPGAGALSLRITFSFFFHHVLRSVFFFFFSEGFVPLAPLSQLGLSLILHILVLGGGVLGCFSFQGRM